MLTAAQPTFSAGERARSQCCEHVCAAQRAEALPDVGPLDIAAKQLREMTAGQVNMHGSDDHRRERVQQEGGQRKTVRKGMTVAAFI